MDQPLKLFKKKKNLTKYEKCQWSLSTSLGFTCYLARPWTLNLEPWNSKPKHHGYTVFLCRLTHSFVVLTSPWITKTGSDSATALIAAFIYGYMTSPLQKNKVRCYYCQYGDREKSILFTHSSSSSGAGDNLFRVSPSVSTFTHYLTWQMNKDQNLLKFTSTLR